MPGTFPRSSPELFSCTLVTRAEREGDYLLLMTRSAAPHDAMIPAPIPDGDFCVVVAAGTGVGAVVAGFFVGVARVVTGGAGISRLAIDTTAEPGSVSRIFRKFRSAEESAGMVPVRVPLIWTCSVDG